MDVLTVYKYKCEKCGILAPKEDLVAYLVGLWMCRSYCGLEALASDHSSSYDGGGDSLSDSSPPAAEYAESPLDPDQICVLCGGYYPGSVVPCGVCGDALCDACSVDCVPCDAGVCSGCMKGNTCRTCESIYKSRSFHEFELHSNLSTTARTPLQFQLFLDKLSKHKGVIIDLDDRDEDGLELNPPLPPLPKVAPPGQRVIDDYIQQTLILSPPSS